MFLSGIWPYSRHSSRLSPISSLNSIDNKKYLIINKLGSSFQVKVKWFRKGQSKIIIGGTRLDKNFLIQWTSEIEFEITSVNSYMEHVPSEFSHFLTILVLGISLIKTYSELFRVFLVMICLLQNEIWMISKILEIKCLKSKMSDLMSDAYFFLSRENDINPTFNKRLEWA